MEKGDIKGPASDAATSVIDQGVGEIITQDEEGPVADYHRSLSTRQIHIISLGSNIGSGLFIATGKALANGGPGSMVIGYGIVTTCVASFLQTMSEMTIAFPTSGNFIDFAARFVDPAWAFSAGMAEWLGWTAVAAAEAVFFDIIINHWAGGSVHRAVWYTVYLAIITILFCLPNKYFGWFEYITSILKVTILVIFICAAFSVVLGAGPTGRVHTGETWRDYPVFLNGFKGMSNSMLLAIWACGDQIFTGIMAGEAASPRHSMAHAAKLVPIRVTVIIMLMVTFATLLVPSNDPRLFGGSGVTASPFVIALMDAGIPVLPDILNAVLLIGIVAIGAESIYLSSRMLRALAHQGLIHKSIAAIDSRGIPRVSIAITMAVAYILTYANLSSSGVVMYTWFVSITSTSFFMVWALGCITSWRFRAALKAQADPLFQEIYAFECLWWPLPPIWLFACCILFTVGCFYIGLYPIGQDVPSVYSFFSYMIGLILVAVSGLGYKLVYGTKVVDPRFADLKTGRRPIVGKELEDLRAYYAMPKWRRFGTYIQLW